MFQTRSCWGLYLGLHCIGPLSIHCKSILGSLVLNEEADSKAPIRNCIIKAYIHTWTSTYSIWKAMYRGKGEMPLYAALVLWPRIWCVWNIALKLYGICYSCSNRAWSAIEVIHLLHFLMKKSEPTPSVLHTVSKGFTSKQNKFHSTHFLKSKILPLGEQDSAAKSKLRYWESSPPPPPHYRLGIIFPFLHRDQWWI